MRTFTTRLVINLAAVAFSTQAAFAIAVGHAPGPGPSAGGDWSNNFGYYCQSHLRDVDRDLNQSMSRLQANSGNDSKNRCTVYRQHIATLKAARKTMQFCTFGPERAENIGQLDVSIADFDGAVKEQCGN